MSPLAHVELRSGKQLLRRCGEVTEGSTHVVEVREKLKIGNAALLVHVRRSA